MYAIMLPVSGEKGSDYGGIYMGSDDEERRSEGCSVARASSPSL
jgi:hypothetical protein